MQNLAFSGFSDWQFGQRIHPPQGADARLDFHLAQMKTGRCACHNANIGDVCPFPDFGGSIQ
jgi:hypothetical protein